MRHRPKTVLGHHAPAARITPQAVWLGVRYIGLQVAGIALVLEALFRLAR